MEAIVIHNLTRGSVFIRGVFTLPKVQIKAGSSHMFSSVQEYHAYKSQVDILVASGFLKLETVKETKGKSVSVGGIPVPPKKEDGKEEESVEDTKDESTETEKSTVDKKATLEMLKAALKKAQADFKASKSKEEKEELKKQILEIKERVKTL